MEKIYGIEDKRSGKVVAWPFSTLQAAKNHAMQLCGNDYPGRFVAIEIHPDKSAGAKRLAARFR